MLTVESLVWGSSSFIGASRTRWWRRMMWITVTATMMMMMTTGVQGAPVSSTTSQVPSDAPSLLPSGRPTPSLHFQHQVLGEVRASANNNNNTATADSSNTTETTNNTTTTTDKVETRQNTPSPAFILPIPLPTESPNPSTAPTPALPSPTRSPLALVGPSATPVAMTGPTAMPVVVIRPSTTPVATAPQRSIRPSSTPSVPILTESPTILSQPSSSPKASSSDQPSDVPSDHPSDTPSDMPSDRPTQLAAPSASGIPSATPSMMQASRPSLSPTGISKVSCSICPLFTELGNPTVTIQNPFDNTFSTCQQVDQLAQAGTFTDNQCQQLQNQFGNTCQCTPLPACSLCASSTAYIGQPNATFYSPLSQQTVTCAQAEQDAQAGRLTPDECRLVQNQYGSDPCQCTENGGGGGGTATNVTGRVVLTLRSLNSLLAPSAIQSYENACTSFFADQLQQTTPTFVDIQVSLTRQILLATTSRGLRTLQTDNSSNLLPLQTLMEVTGTAQAEYNNSAFTALLVLMVKSHESDLVRALQAENELALVQSVDAAPGASISPTPAPGPSEASSSSSSSLSTGAIAGIAAGGAVGFGILMVVLAMAYRRGQDDHGSQYPSRADEVDLASDNMPGAAAALGGAAVVGGAAAVASSSQRQSVKGSMKKPQQDISFDQNTVGGNGSLMDNSNSDRGGDDGMSYAYSLDAGNVDQPSTAVNSSRPGAAGAVAGAAIVSSGTQEDESLAATNARANMVTREVVAPPGKLGIVIDTTLEGPVVHRVNPTSPLEGSVFPGDIIVAIDDVDTRAMSASAITALMVKTANQRRKLTVMSEDVTS